MQTTLDVDRDALITRLKSFGIPNVWEQTVPAGTTMPKENGVYLPYAVISFGGLSPVAQPMQGIVGARADLQWTSVAVESVGATPKIARQLETIVRDAFQGYIPGSGWGEMREQLSDSYTVKVPDMDLWPVRYVRAMVFNAQTGA